MLGTWFLKSFGKRSEDATGANDEPFSRGCLFSAPARVRKEIADPREGKDPYSYPGMV
jgi:hypothetical protein